MNMQYRITTLDMAMCVIGACLMIDGNFRCERTTHLATIAGIIGISTISTCTRTLRGR
jgi:hypothetical protein